MKRARLKVGIVGLSPKHGWASTAHIPALWALSEDFEITGVTHTNLASAHSNLLLEWEHAPSARAAHPQEDHLIPLLVAVGAAEEEPGEVIYREENFFGMMTVSSYRFGNPSLTPKNKGETQ